MVFWESFFIIVLGAFKRQHIMLLNSHNTTYRELEDISDRMTITGGNKKFCQHEKLPKVKT